MPGFEGDVTAVSEEFLPKGKLIYEVPEEDYHRKKREDLFSTYLNLAVIFLFLFVGAYLVVELYRTEGFTLPFCFITGIILMGGTLILSYGTKTSVKARLYKFKIYENGFVAPIRLNEQAFIPFEDIIQVEHSIWDFNFALKLEDGKVIKVYSDWSAEGYIILLKIIRDMYPDPSLPDIDILSRYLMAHEKLLKKEITKREFEPFVEEIMREMKLEEYHRDTGGD